MTSYKQNVKNKSRIDIWSSAIERLTTQSESSRVLDPEYLKNLIKFCWGETLHHVFDYDVNEFLERGNTWVNQLGSTYHQKKTNELKIAFFCGPEPENDLDILLNLGVKIENVWAFEIDSGTYDKALNKARDAYPKLKIFPGSIGEFFKTTHHTFDIIYLDFVGSLLSRPAPPIAIINSVFDNQALSDLGVLIINSCEPEKNDENTEFLTNYFYSHPMVESSVLEKENTEDDGISYFTESPISHGHTPESLSKAIDNNFSGTYSAFSTSYVLYYSSMLSPTLRFLQNQALKRQLFNEKKSENNETFQELSSVDFFKKLILEENAEGEEENDSYNCSTIAGDRFMDSESFPFWNFIDSLDGSGKKVSSYFKSFFTQSNEGVSILNAAQFRESFHSMLTGAEKLLSKRMLSALPKIMQTIPDARGGLFCDIPMPHLWLEVALNQLGAPYHVNIKKHKRWKYTAKVRTMYTDLFVFDRCRGFYESLPMIDQYESTLTDIEEQIFARCCLDIIGKQCRWPLPNLYFGSNLICINDSEWSDFAELGKRILITEDSQ
ncbi:hypothetical protein [Rahnella aceris]|uniref:hypothetical protein n=1 Tax=Rahnella sp. (strain Y9602) TaxID=2703885 RepID=UPI003BA1C37E